MWWVFPLTARAMVGSNNNDGGVEEGEVGEERRGGMGKEEREFNKIKISILLNLLFNFN